MQNEIALMLPDEFCGPFKSRFNVFTDILLKKVFFFYKIFVLLFYSKTLPSPCQRSYTIITSVSPNLHSAPDKMGFNLYSVTEAAHHLICKWIKCVSPATRGQNPCLYSLWVTQLENSKNLFLFSTAHFLISYFKNVLLCKAFEIATYGHFRNKLCDLSL